MWDSQQAQNEGLRIDSPFMGAGMPKAYSRDLRERVITAVEPCVATRGSRAFRDQRGVGGKVAAALVSAEERRPEPRGGSVSPLEEFAVEILDLIAQRPDLTLVETVAEPRSDGSKPAAARSGVFSTDTTSRSKKVLQAAERQRADVARARRRWIREQGMLDPARLVFIDETAVSTNMVRLRGRAPCGVWVIGAVPLGRWETITFVAALRHNKMVAPMVVEGAMTGEMFLAYVENCLVPTLRRNDIVVMDNCRVHLGTGIGRAIETVGATLRYLPKYSPDLNPIEMPYSKFKTFLRKVAAQNHPKP